MSAHASQAFSMYPSARDCTDSEHLPCIGFGRHSGVLLLYTVAHPFLTLTLTLPNPRNGGPPEWRAVTKASASSAHGLDTSTSANMQIHQAT